MGDIGQILGAEYKENKIVLLSISSKSYREKLKQITEFSMKNFKKVCYVTLNDPQESIAQKLAITDASKVFFIDCVTRTIKPPEPKEGVAFVSSPKAFTEISIALKKALKDQIADFAVFDSISALMVYEKSMTVLKFVHSLILTCREGQISAAFIILKEDVDGSMLKDLTMFVDKVIESE